MKTKNLLKKNIFFFMFLSGLCLSVTSCDKDDDDNKEAEASCVSSLPELSKLGIDQPSSIIEYSDAEMSKIVDSYVFSYENDMMKSVEFDGQKKGTLILSQNPLSIVYSDLTLSKKYSNFLINSLGCVTNYRISISDTVSYSLSFSYDEDGHLSNYRLDYNNSSYEIKYTWEDENLTKIDANSSFSDFDQISNYKSFTCTFRYGTDLNNGLFISESESDICIPELYSGLLGKPSKNLPVSCVKATYPIGIPSSYVYLYEYKFNDDNSVSSYKKENTTENEIHLFNIEY